MLNPDTELLFPLRVVPSLADVRGDIWRQFILNMDSPETDKLDEIAFVMMIVRLSGCVACNADSFRAMRGCTQCARQTVRRNRGSDQDLIRMFEQIRQELSTHIQKK